MRLYHRKHQCYLVGEGSFVGPYGDLPDVTISDETGKGNGIAESILDITRKASLTGSSLYTAVQRVSSVGQRESSPSSSTGLFSVVQVIADVEPIREAASLAGRPPASKDVPKSTLHVPPSGTPTSTLGKQQLPLPISSRDEEVGVQVNYGDQVVSEDGEI